MSAIAVGLLLIRLTVGLTFFGHGAQKVLGWWEGPGFQKWTAGIARQRLRPAVLWAAVGAGNEFVFGPLFALGLLTPIAAAVLVSQSLYIVVKVHWPRGFWNTKGGIEFALQLLSAAIVIVVTGPGAISLDALLGLSFAPELRIALFAVGVIGALGAVAIARAVEPVPPGPAKAA